MAIRSLGFNCGGNEIGGWPRGPAIKEVLKEAEKEVITYIQNVEYGWTKILIATLLKEQEDFRKILRKHGFRKTPEAKSKYKNTNTQCIYYFDSNCLKALKEKQKKAKKK